MMYDLNQEEKKSYLAALNELIATIDAVRINYSMSEQTKRFLMNARSQIQFAEHNIRITKPIEQE